ncbi:unnamed protein product [Orchesella dallaii]|uniref:Uncharacterized protein n=1 Tax=Orchesella dallaii TaxID=48710 RepID=A0ABP1QYT8_9HEXA
MSLKSIEQVNGRKNEGEELTADCFIRKISLQGRNYDRPDLIKLKKHSFENLGEISHHTTTNCRPNVTIIVEVYPTIESEVKERNKGDNDDEDKEGNVLEMGLQQEQPAQIIEWKFVLFEVGQEILENVPKIPRMFKCDECEEKSCLVEYSVGEIALMFVIMLFAVPNIAREERSRRKRKYEMEIQRRSQRDVKSGTKSVKLVNRYNLK